MFSFGRSNGQREDPSSPELQSRNAHSSLNNSNHAHQRRYHERPMSPHQNQQNIGRGRHHFLKKSNYPGGSNNAKTNGISSNDKSNKNGALSPQSNRHPISPRQQHSPREYQRNNNRNFKAKKRFGAAGFLGSNKNRKSPAENGDQGINFDETTHGIEVSFEPKGGEAKSPRWGSGQKSTNNNSSSPTKRPQSRSKFHLTPRHINKPRRKEEDRDPSVAEEDSLSSRAREPVISFPQQYLQRQRIYKSQFTTTLLPPSTTMIVSPTSRLQSSNAASAWRPRGHRIPLCGVSPSDTNISDALHLLQTFTVVDERTAVRQELSQLQSEIDALNLDRTSLEEHQKAAISAKNQQVRGSLEPQGESALPTAAVDWNVNDLLKEAALKKQPLSAARRMSLQQQRGNCITMHIHDTSVQETLLHKCSGKLHHIQRSRLFKNDDTILTLSPDNCNPHGAATTLQHVAVTSSSENRSTGVFLSRDNGRSQSGGHFPNKLLQRMESSSSTEDAKVHDINGLQYLSTGPGDTYYAEFLQGECWWGLPVEDPELNFVLQTWDVYRVAFGPLEHLQEEEEGIQDRRDKTKRSTTVCSWMVIGQDGRAAWKNLPPSLSQKLECRLSSRCAPVEVSLGSGGSYFVRFLDGSIDYCLPAKVARVCDRIEKRGGTVTNVCLHADISHDFVIRHTELSLPR